MDRLNSLIERSVRQYATTEDKVRRQRIAKRLKTLMTMAVTRRRQALGETFP